MKGFVRGFTEGLGGNYREIVFYKRCENYKELTEAFETALNSPATTILTEKESESKTKSIQSR